MPPGPPRRAAWIATALVLVVWAVVTIGAKPVARVVVAVGERVEIELGLDRSTAESDVQEEE